MGCETYWNIFRGQERVPTDGVRVEGGDRASELYKDSLNSCYDQWAHTAAAGEGKS